MFIKLYYNHFELVVAQYCNATVVGSLGKGNMIYEYFHVFALARRQKRGVEFRHSPCNASYNSTESGERSV